MLQWLETIISTALRKKPAEDKVKSMFSLDKPEPLVCFALCIGALSDPVVTSFDVLLLILFTYIY